MCECSSWGHTWRVVVQWAATQITRKSVAIFSFEAEDAVSPPKVKIVAVSSCYTPDNHLRVCTSGKGLQGVFLPLLHLQGPTHCEQEQGVGWWSGWDWEDPRLGQLSPTLVQTHSSAGESSSGWFCSCTEKFFSHRESQGSSNGSLMFHGLQESYIDSCMLQSLSTNPIET